jgi:monoamine oxidase
LDSTVSKEDKEKLIAALREWGALDGDLKFTTDLHVSSRRGYDRAPGGGVNGAPTPSKINSLSDVLSSHVWTQMSFYFNYVMQTTMFQPKGGMDMIGKGFYKQIAKLVRLNTKVTGIRQDDKGVAATWTDTVTGKTGVATADYMVCTLPATILAQMDIQVSDAKKAAIKAIPYSGQVKIGLEMKSRFWEQKYSIYGGHSFTDQAIGLISYPNYDFFKDKPAVLLGAFQWRRRIHAGGDDARKADRGGFGARQRVPPRRIPPRIHERCLGGMEPDAVDPWLLRHVDRGKPGDPLPEPRLDGRAHRVGGRTCLLLRLLDGGGAALLARCDHAPAQARSGRIREPRDERTHYAHDQARSALDDRHGGGRFGHVYGHVQHGSGQGLQFQRPAQAGRRQGRQRADPWRGCGGDDRCAGTVARGYKVQVLEYNDRVGGRSWTLQGGDTYTELGGATQTCQFAPGNYINPGPWRIPWHHHGLIHYCHELGIALEPFMQVNYNAYVHNTKAFGGKPQRYRHIQADFYGHVGELLAKSVNAGALAQTVSKEDGEILLEALRSWGALDRNMRYVKGLASSGRRGYDKEPGGGFRRCPNRPNRLMCKRFYVRACGVRSAAICNGITSPRSSNRSAAWASGQGL